MTHGSLFSGIGGFDYAAALMGWENMFHCEWNPFGQKILRQHFPDAQSYSDIATTDFTIWNGRIDILTGGFPCQPFSNIGEQRGDKDTRYMWPQFYRSVREIGPPWVVAENVYGLVGWNDGAIFDKVCADLEAEGYEVAPYVLPASGVGAGHQRNRVWIVAHSLERRLQGREYGRTEGYGQAKNGSVPALVEDRNWTEYAQSFIPGGVYGLPTGWTELRR